MLLRRIDGFHDFVDSQIIEQIVPGIAIIAVSPIKLLEEPQHPLGTQFPLEDIDTPASHFFLGQDLRVQVRVISSSHTNGFSTLTCSCFAFLADILNILSSVVNKTSTPAASAHARCKPSTGG